MGVYRFCGDHDRHEAHQLGRALDGDWFDYCRGVTTVPFKWFQPVTRYIVLRAAHGSPLVGSIHDGRWIERPSGANAGVNRIVMDLIGGRAVLRPSGTYERRHDDGVVAEVWWEYPPAEPGRPGRTLLVEACPDDLPDLVEMWSR